MYVLKTKEKPSYAKRNSDDFYYRDRARKDCEGVDGGTKFATREQAEAANNGYYEVVEV